MARTPHDYQFQFADHVVSRALWLALHDERGGLLFPPGAPCTPAADRYTLRALEWRESVEAAHERR